MKSRIPVALLSCLILMGVTATVRGADAPLVEVWKSSTCGCCRAWVQHLEKAGFRVKVTEMDDVTPIKRQLNVRPELSSCHTARVGGYIVEGHVPAEDILRMLKTQPKIVGLYLPGMPVGSPGMEGPGGQQYQVQAVDLAGRTSVFSTHRP